MRHPVVFLDNTIHMYQVSIFQKFTDNECFTLKFHNMNLTLFEIISYVLIVVFQETKDNLLCFICNLKLTLKKLTIKAGLFGDKKLAPNVWFKY